MGMSEWLDNLLLTATSERKKIQAIELPDEPKYEEPPPRVDHDEFGKSVEGLMLEHGDNIKAAEDEKTPEQKEQDKERHEDMQKYKGSHDFRV